MSMKSKQSEKGMKRESDGADQDLQASLMGLRSWLLKLFILTLSVVWGLALMIRLTVRDSGGVVPTLVFYMSPLILLSLGATMVCVLSLYIRWHRISLIWLVLAVVTGSWCWSSQFQGNELQSTGNENKQSEMRVLFWNIGDRIWGMERVLDELRTVDADLIGLVEAGADSAEMKQFWQTSFPDHPFQVVKNGFVFLSRIPVSHHQSGTLTQMGIFERLSLTLDREPGAELSVYLVDINSDVMKSRKGALLALAKQVSEFNNQPILVLGDFNTPSDSVHFRPLRKYLRNSFEIAGDGYMATWPLPVPVLDLDSIWLNDRLAAVVSENRWTWVSDHRPIVTEIVVKSLKQQ